MAHCEQINGSRVARELLTDDLAIFLVELVLGSKGSLSPIRDEEVLEVPLQREHRRILNFVGLNMNPWPMRSWVEEGGYFVLVVGEVDEAERPSDRSPHGFRDVGLCDDLTGPDDWSTMR